MTAMLKGVSGFNPCECECPNAAIDVSGGLTPNVSSFDATDSDDETCSGSAGLLRLAISRLPIYSIKKEINTPARAMAVATA